MVRTWYGLYLLQIRRNHPRTINAYKHFEFCCGRAESAAKGQVGRMHGKRYQSGWVCPYGVSLSLVPLTTTRTTSSIDQRYWLAVWQRTMHLESFILSSTDKQHIVCFVLSWSSWWSEGQHRCSGYTKEESGVLSKAWSRGSLIKCWKWQWWPSNEVPS